MGAQSLTEWETSALAAHLLQLIILGRERGMFRLFSSLSNPCHLDGVRELSMQCNKPWAFSPAKGPMGRRLLNSPDTGSSSLAAIT